VTTRLADARRPAPPTAIRTERLLLRCWTPSDAASLKNAIDSSLPELQPWVPWAVHEPSLIDALAERLAGMRDRFRSGEDWAYGVFDAGETRVLGGTGLHARGSRDHLEIGYWIRTDATGQGFATESAAALCAAAFECTGVDRVEIHCDARNVRSAAVPRRLGFLLDRTFRQPAASAGGGERQMQVWTMTRPAGLEPLARLSW
jgi:RimJ/RimL family protein N-acetyltransferase